jgi:xanthine dehydrogenase accessory factor
MRRDIFDRLNKDRADKVPVVLATFLRSGEQTLLYLPSENRRQTLDPKILDAARAAIIADRSTTFEAAEGPVFLNVFNPPLRMLVVGAVHIAQALAPMASLAGYEVAIVDPRRAFASAERFPNVSLSHDWPDEAMAKFKPDLRSAVVALTHDPKLDDPALAAALASEAFYIGALGSKKTHAARLERLRARGVPERELGRIYGPIGLEIGAQSPAEIAIAILAQATVQLRQPDVRAKAAE